MFRKCWFLLSLYFDVDDDHHHHHHHPVITFLSPAPFDSVSPSLRETLCSLGSWGTTHASSPGCFLLIAPPSFSWNSYMLCSPSTAHCSSHSWVMSPSLTIQIIPHMLMATPVCRCQTHLSSPGPHRFQRCPRGCSRRVSTWSFRKKLIVFPLNHLLLLLRHVRHGRASLPPVTQARNAEVVLDSIFILVPHFQTILPASISQIGTFLLFWLPTALILTPPPLTWTSYVVSSLLAYPLQACYPSNFPKHKNDPIIPWIKAPPRPFLS